MIPGLGRLAFGYFAGSGWLSRIIFIPLFRPHSTVRQRSRRFHRSDEHRVIIRECKLFTCVTQEIVASGMALVDIVDMIVHLEHLPRWRDKCRRHNIFVIATNGCFDLLHYGHVTLLQSAAQYAPEPHTLIVGVNSDSAVRSLKGPCRPVIGEEDRIRMLDALSCVGAVVLVDSPKMDGFLRAAAPDRYVKAGYTLDSLDAAERAVLAGVGSEIVFRQLVGGISTSEIVDRVLSSRSAKAEPYAQGTTHPEVMFQV